MATRKKSAKKKPKTFECKIEGAKVFEGRVEIYNTKEIGKFILVLKQDGKVQDIELE